MSIYLFLNPKSGTDLDKILSKNLLKDRLVKSTYKFVKSVAKTNNKIRESKTSNEIINNPIYSNR